jgi:hypothetical protein
MSPSAPRPTAWYDIVRRPPAWAECGVGRGRLTDRQLTWASVRLSLCTTVQPLYTRLSNKFGRAGSEVALRLSPKLTAETGYSISKNGRPVLPPPAVEHPAVMPRLPAERARSSAQAACRTTFSSSAAAAEPEVSPFSPGRRWCCSHASFRCDFHMAY